MALSEIAAKPAQHAPRGGGVPCPVCEALATIPPAEADGLRTMLADKERRYTHISKDIEADPDTPLLLNAPQLARHARGDCAAREKLR